MERAAAFDFDLAPAVRDILAQDAVPMLIGGEWLGAASGRAFPTYNPASGAVLAHIAEGDAQDIDRAVAAARDAFERGPWPAMSPAERGETLWRLADLIERDAAIFGQLETLDNGRPYSLTMGRDARSNARHFRYHAGMATKITGQSIPVSVPGQFVYTRREPMGVCGAIIPWNFPLNMATWKTAPALAAGNTVVLKPAEQTPLTTLHLGRLALEAGIPPGVLNVVPGYGHTAGAALVAHRGVDKVAFTGSTEVGRRIMQAAAGNLKRVSLELGGKSPNVIFADADIPTAARQAVWAILVNSGQNCCAGSRLFVQRAVYDQVMDELVKAMREVRVGVGFDPQSQIGPLISQEQLARVAGYVRAGQDAGAQLLAGGGRPEGVPDGGYFLAPTVFGGATDDMAVVREEIFGPVLAALVFDEFDEVVARANDTPYGLASGVWTSDMAKAHRFAAAIKAGTVWVNGYNLWDPAVPFGGYKESGYGRELGEAVYELYTQTKTVWMGIG
ncbi:aldehyde dehydrogenase family protein [Chloroflexia bacterium SDU3-3]|nr:aldehyde dehydrogenase family protein [Chloroflexia bacterium SDU3-3]